MWGTDLGVVAVCFVVTIGLMFVSLYLIQVIVTIPARRQQRIAHYNQKALWLLDSKYALDVTLDSNSGYAAITARILPDGPTRISELREGAALLGLIEVLRLQKAAHPEQRFWLGKALSQWTDRWSVEEFIAFAQRSGTDPEWQAMWRLPGDGGEPGTCWQTLAKVDGGRTYLYPPLCLEVVRAIQNIAKDFYFLDDMEEQLDPRIKEWSEELERQVMALCQETEVGQDG